VARKKRARRRLRKAVVPLCVVVLLGIVAVKVLHLPSILSLRDPRATLTVWLADPSGGRKPFRLGPAHPQWTPLRHVSRALRTCVVASEDDRFFDHHGLDLVEAGKSLEIDLQRGRYVRGASTISMQLARNLFLSGKKTIRRKTQEVAIALCLEQALTKQRILELYLNVVEWGPGIRGIGSAARAYYEKPPSALDWGESAFLAVMLPNPHRYQPRIRPVTLRRRQRQLVERLIREKRIPAADRERARRGPPPRAVFEGW
jgi:monofunctional biosynthetic peptidoglycan transglycosylase